MWSSAQLLDGDDESFLPRPRGRSGWQTIAMGAFCAASMTSRALVQKSGVPKKAKDSDMVSTAVADSDRRAGLFLHAALYQ